MKYIRNILAALRKADRDYSLIDSGDKILVGLSGGKDSLSLLRALSVYGKFANKEFTVKPVFLDLGFGNADVEGLKKYCASLGYELYVSDSRFVYDVLKAHQGKKSHIPCSICSRMKKAAMNRIAKDLGYNKVAFAHHNDDAVETLFMNMIHGARVATFEPKMYLEKAGITFIRPLIYCKESDLRGLANEEQLPVLASKCPANGNTEREWTKEFLQSIYATHPEARDNFRSMLFNYRSFELYFNDIEMESEEDHTYALKPLLSPDEMRHSSFANTVKKEGEEDYLILHQHQKVGEIAFRHLNDHRVLIFHPVGDKKALVIAIKELVDKLGREINPITFVLAGGSAAMKIQAGFAKKTEPGVKGEHYILRLIK
jgi:tRNA 2-thiocytidine biosynthesis protein TtcA